jgi:transposase-like protein
MCVNCYCPMCGHTHQEETELDVELFSTVICLGCEKEFLEIVSQPCVVTSLDKFHNFHNPIPF